MQTTLSVRMDAEVKRRLDSLCAEVGMTTSTAINMFAKAFIRERRLPFEVKASDLFSFANEDERFKESVRQLKEGEVVVKTIDELEKVTDE